MAVLRGVILQIAEQECVVILPAQCVCVMLCMSGGGNPGTFNFIGSEVTLNEEWMGEDRRFQEKKTAQRKVVL